MPPLLHSRRLSGKYGIHGEKMCFCFYFILSSCLCVLEGYKDGGCKNKAKRNNNSFFISATLPFSIFSKTEDLLFIMRFIAVCFLQAPHDQVGTLAKCQRNHAVLPIKPEGFKVRVSPWKQQHISPQAALCKA